MVAYTQIAGGIVGGGIGPCQPGHNNGPNDSNDPNGGGDIGPVAGEETQRRVSGSCTQAFTVHQGFAALTQALLNATCVDGIIFGGSGWRSAASQIALRRKHCGTSHDAIYNMPSTQCRPPTARPGNSMHERGQAIDFTVNGAGLTRGSAGYRWLAVHAKHFGFYNLPSEPWHWSTNGR